MHRTHSVKVNDFNTFLSCPLCKGYLIDSYTINECLHSFCKSCIIKYVKNNECCPICKVDIMKDKMNLFLKRDVNLQYIVYKLVPGLFKEEMKRRRLFYSKHPKSVEFLKKRKIHDKETVGELEEDIFLPEICTDISLSIEYSETGLSEICDSLRIKENPAVTKSYLQCPSNFTIESLKKFLSLKNEFISTKLMDIMYDDKPLSKDLTLIDISHIYAWRRTAPMRLFYRLNKNEQENNTIEPTGVSQPLSVSNKIENNPLEQSNQNKSNKLNDLDDKENQCNNKTLEESITENSQIHTENNKSDLKQPKIIRDEHDQTAEMHNTTDVYQSNSHHHNTTNPQTINENLTITAMVASIAQKDKTPIIKQEAVFNPQISKLSESTDIISNSDKENDDIIYVKKPEQTLPPPVQPNLFQQEIKTNEAIQYSNDSNKKAIKPKKPKVNKKKEAFTNSNNINSSNMNTTADIPNKKAKTVKPKPGQNPIDLTNKPDVKQHSETNQYNQQHQYAAAAAAAAAHYSLPFANKLNAPNGINPALPGMMTPNFNLMPMNIMSHLMQSSANKPDLYPWKGFDSNTNHQNMFNYNNQIPNMNDLKQAQVASALMNPKFNPSFLEYFQSKASTFQQQPNYLNPIFNHHQPGSNSDDFKKSFTGFNSLIHDQMSMSYSQPNFNQDLMRNLNYINTKMTNQQEQHQHQHQQGQHFSSSSSNCSNDSSSLDSLKETQLRISESCNLVNESN